MFIRILSVFLVVLMAHTCVFPAVADNEEEETSEEWTKTAFDITREISPTSPCVPSSSAPTIEDLEANGPLYNESCYPHMITTTSYAGTCIAAPSLFDGNWKNINNIPLKDLIMVNCVIVDLSKILNKSDNVQISAEDLKEFEHQHETITPKSFVIIYTGWAKHWSEENRQYMKKYPILSKEAIDYLIDCKTIGIGIDGPTIDKKNDGFPIQDRMFSKGMFIVKNLSNELANIKYCFGKAIIAPLKFENSNEAPARVFFIPQEEKSFFQKVIAKIKGWFDRA